MNQMTPAEDSAILIGMSNHAKQIIGMDSDQGSLVERINTICQRYGMIITRDCPALSVAEWMVICEALMEPKLIDLHDWENVQTFWVEFCDVDSLGGLGNERGIDVFALAARLKLMPYAEICAVLEVASRFWADKSGRAWSSDKEMLEDLGAKIGYPQEYWPRYRNNEMQMKRPKRIHGCQSTNHMECRGELWTCEGCGKTVCYNEGNADNYPELCDDCWYKKTHNEPLSD